jgi:hypothetical protein
MLDILQDLHPLDRGILEIFKAPNQTLEAFVSRLLSLCSKPNDRLLTRWATDAIREDIRAVCQDLGFEYQVTWEPVLYRPGQEPGPDILEDLAKALEASQGGL